MGSMLKTILFGFSAFIILAVFFQAVRRHLKRRKRTEAPVEQEALTNHDELATTNEPLNLHVADDSEEEVAGEVEPLLSQTQVEMNFDETIAQESEVEETPSFEESDILMLSVHAKPGQSFGDYDFLQTLGSAGLVFGEHSIFHYDVKTDQGDERLFSVAKLNKPGTFDIDDVKSLDCKGLLLFVDLAQSRKPALAVNCLLETAKQLADDLHGQLFEGYNNAWSDEVEKHITKRAEAYQEQFAVVLDDNAC